MDRKFVIWILSRRPEMFDWRDESLWPEGYALVVFEDVDLFLSNLKSRKPDFALLDWELISQNAHPVVLSAARLAPLSEIYLFSLPEGNPLFSELSSWDLSGAYSTSYSAATLREKITEMIELKLILNEAGLVGRSRHLKRVASIIKQIAPTDATVLITGESGTGKELIARAVHANSRLKDRTYVSVNSAAITESLLETELFGHEKGAFTGADRRHSGYFETASGGSIFLDEIGEFKLDLQARLLRVLEQKTFYRVGGTEQLNADVRIICATNHDLKRLVEEGKFRADLYYRLSVIQIMTEPLMNRREDIYPLASYFLAQLNSDLGQLEIMPETIAYLLRYSWPGNVRELKNFIQSAAYLSKDKRIKPSDAEEFVQKATSTNRTLPVVTGLTRQQADFDMIYMALINLAREIAEMKTLLAGQTNGKRSINGEVVINQTEDLEIAPQLKTMQETEKELIEKALQAASGNRKLAAKSLGIGERTLYRKIKEYKIN